MVSRKLAAAVLAGAVGSAMAQTAAQFSVQAESRAGKVLVHVALDNTGSTEVFAPRAVLQPGEPFGKLFTLASDDGKPVPYLGAMVKRGPLRPDDYVALAPGRTLRNTLDISRLYRFLPGTHTYTLSYVGPLLVTDLQQLAAFEGLAPPAVRFVHTP